MMMEPFVRGFIRGSLAWLGIGVVIGVAMAFWPANALVYKPAHLHANLLGFVSMMIFGVAYHVIPRFSGAALHARGLARIHLVLANVGLALLVGAWMSRAAFPAASTYPLRIGAALSAVGAALFIYNLWRTLDASDLDARARVAARPQSQPRPATASAAGSNNS